MKISKPVQQEIKAQKILWEYLSPETRKQITRELIKENNLVQATINMHPHLKVQTEAIAKYSFISKLKEAIGIK